MGEKLEKVVGTERAKDSRSLARSDSDVASIRADKAPVDEVHTGGAFADGLHARAVRVAVSWVFVAAWAGFIFFMSSNTGSGLNSGEGLVSQVFCALKDAQAALLGPDVDVVSSIAHFCEYTVFGALLANALRHHMPLRKAVVVALACGSAYGITDEFHQLFVPGRMCDPVDWAVDTAGTLLGAFLLAKLASRKKPEC